MRFIYIIGFFIIVEIYAFQLIRVLAKGHWWKWVYLAVSVLIFLNVVLQFYLSPDRTQVVPVRDFAVTLFLAFLAAKTVFLLIMFFEDIVRIVEGVVSLSRKHNSTDLEGMSDASSSFLPSRRSFIAKTGLALAALPFGAILYGAWKGKYNYQVREYELSFDDLPEEFNGYKISQISDIHVGSFDDKDEVAYAIDLVNKQQSDVILFTGDLVNNVARELYGWEEILGRLKAKDGVFSVLGNHDYGDYVNWVSQSEKRKNLEELFEIQKNMGWRLMMDEAHEIKRGADSLHIVGVQNYGGGRFPKYGNLDKASASLSDSSFKVLMSHDPSHWELQVKDHPKKFHLTLSGHTHGMQFGVEIPGFFKWSPVSFVYKRWAGIYKELDQFLNVNRGFGFIGYSGRAGIWPEITVITLKRA
ncbi:metallophosphoesterase [Nonlabens sp. SCSIO 43208]|uniref:metallophosphoesterase n=1 Tax=Nonlabens sp. SCSIO 43208 TaxID=2793009 RepID=UPI003D6A6DA3